MGRPDKACVDCDWYVRGHAYEGPVGFGGCFRKKRWACANQTACQNGFERGRPCLSVHEAELKWQVKELHMFVDKVANWRHENWMSFLPECYKKEANWEEIEVSARSVLTELGFDFEVQ